MQLSRLERPLSSIHRAIMTGVAAVAVPLFAITPVEAAQPDRGDPEGSKHELSRSSTSSDDDPAANGSLDTAFYVRTDSDQTTIITPSVHFRKGFGDSGTSVDVVYIADIWSSASVDIRSAASELVEEQRDELNLGFDHVRGTTTLGIGYRFSHEVDYISNALALSSSHEAFQRTATFSARVFASSDKVGRSGDEFFEERIRGVGGWFGWTQVLTKKTLIQLSYEWRLTKGYQASPYRWVPIGAANSCAAPGELCIPEVHPETKIRHAFVIRGRQSIGNRLSVGAGYRFYFDLWGIRSHTVLADAAATLGKRTLLALDYRGYTQGAAFFYRQQYESLEGHTYLSRDRELSSLSSHRVGLRMEYEHPFPVGELEWAWRFGVLVSGTFYRYEEFVGLDRVRALEIGTTLGLGF